MSHYLTSILKGFKSRHDDDAMDRVNYHYTSSLIVIFAILVSAKQYVGYPIQCWVPAHFTDAMEQYTENYCWVQNTWFLPLEARVPKTFLQRDERQLIYYQWVPFILLFQSMLFYLPCFMWRILYWQSGLDINTIGEMAAEARHGIEESMRHRTIYTIAQYLEDALAPPDPNAADRHKFAAADPHLKHHLPNPISNHSRLLTSIASGLGYLFKLKQGNGNGSGSSGGKSGTGKRHGNSYIIFVYFLIKLMYCANVAIQFAILHYLLDTKSPMFGLDLLRDLLRGRDWFLTGLFPRVTLCDFEVKVMGNLHRHTVQCVLMINMFNEKIFLFLWFWFFFVMIGTVVSLLIWILKMLPFQRRSSFVRKHLRYHERRMTDTEQSLLGRFISTFLGHDGVFILHIISGHTGGIVLNEITGTLWGWYRKDNISTTDPPLYSENSPDHSAFEYGMEGVGVATTERSTSSSFKDLPPYASSGTGAGPEYEVPARRAARMLSMGYGGSRTLGSLGLPRDYMAAADSGMTPGGAGGAAGYGGGGRSRRSSHFDDPYASKRLLKSQMERKMYMTERQMKKQGLGKLGGKEMKITSKSTAKSDKLDQKAGGSGGAQGSSSRHDF